MKRVVLSIIISFICKIIMAQVPQGINYQALAGDASGKPIRNTDLQVKVSILSDTLQPVVVWEELHSAIRTNSQGIFSLVIGSGVRQSSSSAAAFNDIDWSATPLFIRTQIYYQGTWKNMGSAKLWTVPYAMVAENLSGTLKKLAVTGETANMDEALFEVKNKTGQTVFAVYNEGVRIYVDDGAKGAKGGFAIGGFGGTKTTPQNYFIVKPDTVRIYIDDTPGKSAKGGFAIGGFGTAKGGKNNFLDVATNASGIINPSQNRILWYPLKNAFLTGKVLIENPDSVGENSFATGYESKAKGAYSQALGYKAIARGDYSTAIGKNAIANYDNSFSFGDSTSAFFQNSYAFGRGAKAKAEGSFSFGYNSISTGQDSYAIGTGAEASGQGSFAIGFIGRDSAGIATGNTKASASWALAMGMGSQASAQGAVAIGTLNKASGLFSIALGYGTNAINSYSFSFGLGTYANGFGSTASGAGSHANGVFSTAMGYDSYANGINSVAMGNTTLANGDHSTATGSGSNAIGIVSTAMGSTTKATEFCSTAMGNSTTASGVASTSMGSFTVASGYISTAMGSATRANGDFSTAMGLETVASAVHSTAMGRGSIASGGASTAMGTMTNASGDHSTSMGYSTKAQGHFSIAMGSATIAQGSFSTAMGSSTIAIGNSSTAMGSSTIAIGNSSTAMGSSTTSTGTNSFASGLNTNAYGEASITMGMGTISKPFAAMTLGQYNDTTVSFSNYGWDTRDPVFVIGNGSSHNSRSNAFTVLKSGYTAIGHETPTEMLDVNGNARFRAIGSGVYSSALAISSDGTLTTFTSDISMKKDIEPIRFALQKVLEMNGVYFSWKNDNMNNRRVGFIAQEMEKVLPEVVFTNPVDGLKGINYPEITAVLAQAVKEQEQKIENQQKEIEELKTLVKDFIANQPVQNNK